MVEMLVRRDLWRLTGPSSHSASFCVVRTSKPARTEIPEAL